MFSGLAATAQRETAGVGFLVEGEASGDRMPGLVLPARAGGEHDGPGLMPCGGLALPLWVVIGQVLAAETVIYPASILPG